MRRITKKDENKIGGRGTVVLVFSLILGLAAVVMIVLVGVSKGWF